MGPSPFRQIWDDLGARFTQWNGHEVVDHFGDPEAEYWAVRRKAGALDMSALQKLRVRGPDAEAFLDRVLTRNVATVPTGRVMYSPICREDGSLVDECLLFRIGGAEFLVTAWTEPLEARLRRQGRGLDVLIESQAEDWFCLAIQGPRSRDVLRPIGDIRIDDLEYFAFETTRMAGTEVILSRTGHTGELGYEILGPGVHASAVWKAVAEAGAAWDLKPFGLSAWNPLRMESGLHMWGFDVDDSTCPWDVGLGWAVDLQKAGFVGKEALSAASEKGGSEVLIGLELDGAEPVSDGDEVCEGSGRVGRVTSACTSSGLQKGIALARVGADVVRPGCEVVVGETGEKACVVRVPFSDPCKRKRRGIRYKGPRPVSTAGVLQRLGVKKIINGVGTWAINGGSLMAPEVLEAMQEAAGCFVDITELQRTCGERVAELTGAEAAYICGGASAGLALGAAACMVGTDPEKIAQLPHLEGIRKYEVIMFRTHRNGFDQGTRQAGARIREIGYSWESLPEQLEGAINEHTAAIHYDIFGHMMRPGASLRLEQVLKIAHRRGVPVMLDIAGELPPAENLTRFPAMGVDLTVFSGGKGLMGPQGAGLILGRRDLIDAVTANGNPNYGIGRSMKVDKEEMVGMVRAVELYLARDHEADRRRWATQVEYIADHLSGIPGFDVFVEPGTPHGRPIPQLYVRWDQRAKAMRIEQATDYLANLDPSVWASKHVDCLRINPHMLPEGDEVIMAAMVREFLEGVASGRVFIPPLSDERVSLSGTAPHLA